MSGCTRSGLEADELRAYLRDPGNGVFHELERGPYRITLQYVPPDLLAERELRSVQDPARRDSLIAQYARSSHFVLEIAKNGQDLANAWLIERGRGLEGPELFSHGLKDHLTIDACGVVLPAQQCTYIRMYEIARKSTFLVSFFALPADCEEVTFAMGSALSDLGPVSFEQSINALRKVPKLL